MRLERQGWNRGLAAAIRAIGTPAFAPCLEAALAQLLPFQICMVFAYHGRATPLPLYHNMASARADVVVNGYCNGPYLLDPFFEAVSGGKRDGSATLRQLAPDQFLKSEYYLDHYQRTAIRDELGVFAALPGDGVAVISLGREMTEPLFSARERRQMADVDPVISALVAGHWAGSKVLQRAWKPDPRQPPLAQALAHDLLTPRENDVVALILKGHSSGSIGQTLQISPGTVKIHRKNAYRKLNISSQAQLFARLIGSAMRW